MRGRELILYLLCLLCLSTSEVVTPYEFSELDMKKDVMMVTQENYHELLKKRRDFTAFVLFSSMDERFDCSTCTDLENAVEMMHNEYYQTADASSRKILFAIARYEDCPTFYDQTKIRYLPFAMIINKPEKGKKQKELIPYVAEDRSLTKKSLCDFFNKKLSLNIHLPIDDGSVTVILVFVTAITITFSLLFRPGKGFVSLLKWRGSYQRLSLVVVFLCLACIPYVIIRNPTPYSETRSRKGNIIYSFFGNGEEKYGFEGIIITFWVFLACLSFYGLINWTQSENYLASGIITSLCLAMLIVSLLEVKTDVESSMQFLSQIVEYSSEAIFGRHSCIFCTTYFNYLRNLRAKKSKEWWVYFSKLRKWFSMSFQ